MFGLEATDIGSFELRRMYIHPLGAPESRQ
jgi:hypothetical protein